MQSSKIDRIKDLVEQLNAASESYYAKDQEIMSNYEYDKLYDELVELEKETGVTLAPLLFPHQNHHDRYNLPFLSPVPQPQPEPLILLEISDARL